MKTSKAQLKRFVKSFQEMNKREPFFLRMLIASAVFFVLTLALPIWRIVPIAEMEPFLPLHYNVLFGVDRFGPWYFIFLLPLIGFGILILNAVMQTVYYRSEKLLAKLLAYASVFSQFILLVAMVLIVLLNI